MKTLDRAAVEKIAKGACFLGSGGGGPLSITPTIIDNIFKHTDTIQVVSIDEVPDSAGIAIAAGMGSPQRSAGISFDTAPSVAFDKVAEIYGTLNHVAAVEVGAANTVIPMLVAAEKNIPLVDANGAGRAVPTLPSTTFAQAGISASPAVLSAVGVPGNPSVTCEAGHDAEQVEEWAGKVLTTNPNFTQYNAGAIALWPFSGKKLKEPGSAIGGSLDLAQSIGDALEGQSPVDGIKSVLEQHNQTYEYLGQGKVISVKEESVGALDGGTVMIEFDGFIAELPFLNEFLGAFIWDCSKPRYILGPDMLCCLTPEGEPLSNPAILDKFKQDGNFDICVFAIKANAYIRKESMFELFTQHIQSLFPAFQGGFQKAGSLTMQWAWDE